MSAKPEKIKDTFRKGITTVTDNRPATKPADKKEGKEGEKNRSS